MTLVKAELLTGPPIDPLAGTLLDVATINDTAFPSQDTDDLFESYNCLTTDRRATWACPVTFLAAPVQAAAATATTGGTLPADTYRFKVTAINAEGETIASNEQSVTTTGTTSTATVNWAAVTGATGYRIYATASATNTEKSLVTVGAVTTYTWTGTPAIGNGDVPTFNSAIIDTTKTFQRPSWVDGSRFAVYTGVECKKFGSAITRQEGLAEGKRVFLARESFGVERGLIETVLQGATDLTPTAGTAVDIHVGLAILEGDAATKYAGVPTLHLARRAASLLARDKTIEAQGGKFYTQLGSKVAAGGGYDASNMSPAAAVPAAGTMWLYASGEVLVIRGSLIEKEELNRDNNETIDLIERPYIVTVDCYKSAVLVKVA